MEVGGLYQFVLIIVIVGLVAGVGVLVLDKFQRTSGVTDPAIKAIGNSLNAVADIPEDWMALIVTIGVLAIILSLVIGGFVVARR